MQLTSEVSGDLKQLYLDFATRLAIENDTDNAPFQFVQANGEYRPYAWYEGAGKGYYSDKINTFNAADAFSQRDMLTEISQQLLSTLPKDDPFAAGKGKMELHRIDYVAAAAFDFSTMSKVVAYEGNFCYPYSPSKTAYLYTEIKNTNTIFMLNPIKALAFFGDVSGSSKPHQCGMNITFPDVETAKKFEAVINEGTLRTFIKIEHTGQRFGSKSIAIGKSIVFMKAIGDENNLSFITELKQSDNVFTPENIISLSRLGPTNSFSTPLIKDLPNKYGIFTFGGGMYRMTDDGQYIELLMWNIGSFKHTGAYAKYKLVSAPFGVMGQLVSRWGTLRYVATTINFEMHKHNPSLVIKREDGGSYVISFMNRDLNRLVHENNMPMNEQTWSHFAKQIGFEPNKAKVVDYAPILISE